MLTAAYHDEILSILPPTENDIEMHKYVLEK